MITLKVEEEVEMQILCEIPLELEVIHVVVFEIDQKWIFICVGWEFWEKLGMPSVRTHEPHL